MDLPWGSCPSSVRYSQIGQLLSRGMAGRNAVARNGVVAPKGRPLHYPAVHLVIIVRVPHKPIISVAD